MKEGANCERRPEMKPQSAFDRAASGCGSPSSPSSYDNHPNDHHEQDFFQRWSDQFSFFKFNWEDFVAM